MFNILKVSHQEAIRSLYQKGWSQRRIARELAINRRNVQALHRKRHAKGRIDIVLILAVNV
jgi:transcriptional regulator